MEKEFNQDRSSGRKIELEKKISDEHRDQESKLNNELVDVILPPPHRSSRISYPPERYLGMLAEDVEKIFLIGDKAHGDDLKTYDEAMSDIDSKKWLSAMKSEIDSIHSNQI